MYKKLMVVALSVFMSTATYAQFEKGKTYLGAALSSLNLSYNGNDKASLDVTAKAGYFVADNILLSGQVGLKKQEGHPASYSCGLGGRYYIIQNGIYLGLSADFKHLYPGFNDLQPSAQVGYAFFISRTVTIEPEVYYEQSFKNHRDFRTIGFRLGLGVYL